MTKSEKDFSSAEAWRGRGFFFKAERLYSKVLARGPRQDPALWVEAALASAAGLRSVGKVVAARDRLQRARGMALEHRMRGYLPQIELEDALVDRAAGFYSKSLKRLAPILKRHLRERDWLASSFILWAMGGAYRFQGDLSASTAAFRRSMQLARRAGDPAAQGYALFGLGGVTRIQGCLKDSMRYYSQARAHFTRTEDVFGQAYAHCGLANALRQLGRLREAERHYLRSHALYSKLKDHVDLAYVEWGLGKVYLHQGRLGRSLARLRRALRLFSCHGETRGMVLSEVALAQALHSLGRTAEAEKLFELGRRRAAHSGIHAHLEIFT